MANEIQINGTLRYSKSPVSASLTTSFLDNQIGNKFEHGVQIVGTAEEVLNKGDIGTISYLAFRNLDLTNFVSMGAVSNVYSFTVEPGKGGVVPWNHSNVYVKADTASCDFEYLAIEL